MNESWLDKLSMPEQGYYLYLAAFGYAITIVTLIAALEDKKSQEDDE